MKKRLLLIPLLLFMYTATACAERSITTPNSPSKTTSVSKANTRTIYLAGGCFWGVEGYFRTLPGIISTETGYANGQSDSTSYEKISKTDHAEAVKIDYDISRISLDEILLHYFRVIDPKSVNRQGHDIGRQYRTGIYYINEEQKSVIDKIMDYETKKHGQLAVEVAPIKNYVAAEDYHQDYLKNNPGGYCHINLNLANKPLIADDYPLPSKEELKKTLDSQSYNVIVDGSTEAPGSSPLNNEYRRGIYVDKVTGEPLFASQNKFNSGCGWPSFSRPILTNRISEKKDLSHGMIRREIRSKYSNSHLGHVFTDGPEEQGGLRYCVNGASLKFIPYDEMKAGGYEKYMVLVK